MLRSNQWRLRGSVTTPSWTMRLPERSSGSTSPRFSRHRRRSAVLVIAHDGPGIQAADELASINIFAKRRYICGHLRVPVMEIFLVVD